MENYSPIQEVRESNAETAPNAAPPSLAPPVYDADAQQSVELTLKRTDRGGRIKRNLVTHIFRALTDEEFFQYEAKKNIVQKISGTDILNVRTEDKNLQAAEWLWNQLAVGRTGYVERPDWKEKTDLLDKQTAIQQGLLAVFPANENSDADIFDDATLDAESLAETEFSDDLVDEDAQTIVRIDCLFNSVPVTTTHYFAPPSVRDVTDYESLMKKASNLVDGRKGFRQKKNGQTAQLSIPSKARELCALYDRLIINSEGYANRVPAHHKREAVLEIFMRDADVTEKKLASLSLLVADKVNKLYQTDGGGSASSVCPGEKDCVLGFNEAAGDTYEEKYRNSCFGCSLESTKPVRGEKAPMDEGESEAILYAVEIIKRKRDSGAGLDLAEISMLEWKLILVWDDLIEHHERNLRLYAKALFEALATKGI